jgi:glycosyltransferase involved in cell wall biosynthesis
VSSTVISTRRRERVIYVTPVMPQPFGNGVAMRAASILDALSRRFAVDLFVVPVGGELGPPGEFVRRHAARIGGLDLASSLDPLFGLISRIRDPEERRRALDAYPKPVLSRFCTGDSAQTLYEWAGEAPVAAVHVMRLYMAPLVQAFLRPAVLKRPFCVLDLDDDDVRTNERLAALYGAVGDALAADAAASEAVKYRSFAERHLAAFDCAIACSDADAARLGERFPAMRFAVVPNGYAVLRPGLRRSPPDAATLRLLFVGNFQYFPNVDAAMVLCREVLPALRQLTDRPIAVELAGTGDTTPLLDIARDPSVTLHGFVEDLGPLYGAADVAVVPIRAGGGTRIKLLEAFSHGVPVVATRLGAEGIDAEDGVHLLLADEPAAFARACLQLKTRPQYGAAIANRAASLLLARYSPAQVAAAIATVYD